MSLNIYLYEKKMWFSTFSLGQFKQHFLWYWKVHSCGIKKCPIFICNMVFSIGVAYPADLHGVGVHAHWQFIFYFIIWYWVHVAPLFRSSIAAYREQWLPVHISATWAGLVSIVTFSCQLGLKPRGLPTSGSTIAFWLSSLRIRILVLII